VNRSEVFYPLLSDRVKRGKAWSAAESGGGIILNSLLDLHISMNYVGIHELK